MAGTITDDMLCAEAEGFDHHAHDLIIDDH